jgi:beta-glucanase (GH16 family)
MKKQTKLFGVIAIAAIMGFSMSACNDEKNKNLIFSDDFDGTSLDNTKWDYCPNWDRHGRSTWMDDMVSVKDGFLHLKLKRDAALGANKTNDPAINNNWIRAGAVRTLSRDGANYLFQNSFGYYEARIKFPVVSGTWGAFWLMSPTLDDDLTNGGEEGTEIDIVESIRNHKGQFNAALHWNGYGAAHENVVSGERYESIPVNIYDGDFHTFALLWSPSEYIFYVDDHEFWRVDGGSDFKNCGINTNPNYIKLTIESAPVWPGDIPENFTEAEMLVDYVRVYKNPPQK